MLSEFCFYIYFYRSLFFSPGESVVIVALCLSFGPPNDPYLELLTLFSFGSDGSDGFSPNCYKTWPEVDVYLLGFLIFGLSLTGSFGVFSSFIIELDGFSDSYSFDGLLSTGFSLSIFTVAFDDLIYLSLNLSKSSGFFDTLFISAPILSIKVKTASTFFASGPVAAAP